MFPLVALSWPVCVYAFMSVLQDSCLLSLECCMLLSIVAVSALVPQRSAKALRLVCM